MRLNLKKIMLKRLNYFEDSGSNLKAYPLLLAVYFEREEQAAKIAEDDPAQVNTQDPYGGLTPLHVAIFRQNARLVRMLLACPSIDITIRDGFGRSVVDMLDYTADQEIFEMVIDRAYPDDIADLESEALEQGKAGEQIIPFKPKGP